MTSGDFGVNTASITPLTALIALKAGWLSLVIAWLGQRWKMLTRLFISLRRLKVVKYRLVFIIGGCVVWLVIGGAYCRIKSSKVPVPLLELGLSAAKIIRTGQYITIVALNSELGITIVGR